MKSDVFSFGVIVLETVCGKKNREYFDDNDHDLLGHVSIYVWTFVASAYFSLFDMILSIDAPIKHVSKHTVIELKIHNLNFDGH